MNRLIPVIIAFLVLIVRASNVSSYVQARDDKTGKPLLWKGSQIAFTLSAAHRSSDLSTEAVTAALIRAGEVWTKDVGCNQVELRVASPSPSADRARRDGVNAVLFHENTWCRDGKRTRFSCYDIDEQAVTTTYLERDARTGEVWIAEADIEINSVHYQWFDKHKRLHTSSQELSLSDLLVHELGHILGLAHDCDDGFLSPLSVDHEGHRPPVCGDLAAERPAAMSPTPPLPGTLLTLSSDERRAVCDLYTAPPHGRSDSGCACCAIGVQSVTSAMFSLVELFFRNYSASVPPSS